MLGFSLPLLLDRGILLDHAEQAKGDRVGLRQPLGRDRLVVAGAAARRQPRQLAGERVLSRLFENLSQTTHQENQIVFDLGRIERQNRREQHDVGSFYETRASPPENSHESLTADIFGASFSALAAGPHRELTFFHWRWGPTPSAN